MMSMLLNMDNHGFLSGCMWKGLAETWRWLCCISGCAWEVLTATCWWFNGVFSRPMPSFLPLLCWNPVNVFFQLFQRQAKKMAKEVAATNYNPPKGLLEHKDDKMAALWDLWYWIKSWQILGTTNYEFELRFENICWSSIGGHVPLKAKSSSYFLLGYTA